MLSHHTYIQYWFTWDYVSRFITNTLGFTLQRTANRRKPIVLPSAWMGTLKLKLVPTRHQTHYPLYQYLPVFFFRSFSPYPFFFQFHSCWLLWVGICLLGRTGNDFSIVVLIKAFSPSCVTVCFIVSAFFGGSWLWHHASFQMHYNEYLTTSWLWPYSYSYSNRTSLAWLRFYM